MLNNKLFVCPKPIFTPKFRLFCFPFAGGGIATYLEWADRLPEDVELVLVQPPGRGSRITELPFDSMPDLMEELMQHASFITSIPYAFFGHSLGCRVAFEFCYRIKLANLTLPKHFFASGSRAPHLNIESKNLHQLSDAQFIQELAHLNGTPAEVLSNQELMKIFIPLLRADFKMAETYKAKKVEMPFQITVLSGADDRGILPEQLIAWRELSKENIVLIEFPGDHFFVEQSRDEVVDEVSFRIDFFLERREIKEGDT